MSIKSLTRRQTQTTLLCSLKNDAAEKKKEKKNSPWRRKLLVVPFCEMTHEMLDAVLVHEWEKKVFHIKRWCYREINTLANIFTMSVKCLEKSVLYFFSSFQFSGMY